MGINKTGLICPAISSKTTCPKWTKMRIDSESESDFSFAINSVSDSDSASECDSGSDSDSDFKLEVMNLEICIFFILYLHSSK